MPTQVFLDPVSAVRFFSKGMDFVKRLEDKFNKDPQGIAAYNAEQFAIRLERNITTQKFAGGYPAYSPEYLAWKIDTVGHADFWILFRNIIGSLRGYKSEQGGYEGGIPPGSVITYSDNAGDRGKPLAEIAYRLEWKGVGKRKKKRPIFKPTFAEFRKDAIENIKKKMPAVMLALWK